MLTGGPEYVFGVIVFQPTIPKMMTTMTILAMMIPGWTSLLFTCRSP